MHKFPPPPSQSKLCINFYQSAVQLHRAITQHGQQHFPSPFIATSNNCAWLFLPLLVGMCFSSVWPGENLVSEKCSAVVHVCGTLFRLVRPNISHAWLLVFENSRGCLVWTKLVLMKLELELYWIKKSITLSWILAKNCSGPVGRKKKMTNYDQIWKFDYFLIKNESDCFTPHCQIRDINVHIARGQVFPPVLSATVWCKLDSINDDGHTLTAVGTCWEGGGFNKVVIEE